MSAVSSRRARAREWLADHVPASVWIMFAVWAPPIVFTVLVDLKLVAGAGSGYPSLRDPALLLSVVQILLMAAALPLMHLRRRSRAWQLLCGALGIWALHAAWTILGRLRLVGRSDLVSRETLMTLAALAAAAYVLFEVRDRFTRTALTAKLTTSPPPVALQPDTM